MPEPGSPEHLWSLLYSELRSVAAGILSRSGRRGSVHATQLVHEAFLKLRQERKQALNSTEFVRGVAFAMRRVLHDRARFRSRLKRAHTAPLLHEPADVPDALPPEILLDLDQLLDELARRSPRRAQVLDLRLFTGLGDDEIADLLGIARRTVQYEFRSARAWIMERWGAAQPGPR